MFASTSYRRLVTRHFCEFNQLNREKRIEVIGREAMLLDSDHDNGKQVMLYYLRGFFVEKVIDPATQEIDIIPYKNGYRLYTFLNPAL